MEDVPRRNDEWPLRHAPLPLGCADNFLILPEISHTRRYELNMKGLVYCYLPPGYVTGTLDPKVPIPADVLLPFSLSYRHCIIHRH